jgi:hypothetical protein
LYKRAMPSDRPKRQYQIFTPRGQYMTSKTPIMAGDT